MEIKIRENGKGKSRFSLASFFGALGDFWNRKYRIFFAILTICILAWGGFFWYKSLYNSAWTAEEKEAYRKSIDKGINFQQETFSDAIKIVEERNKNYFSEQSEVKDLFGDF